MSEAADDTNRAIQALREREAEIQGELRSVELHRTMLEAQAAEIGRAIEIVQRNGRKKPGPKPPPREQYADMVATAKGNPKGAIDPAFEGLTAPIPAPIGVAQ
jgi:hypothetical protein